VVTPTDLGWLPWGCMGTSIPTATALGTGAVNTAAIVASCGETSFGAKTADGLVAGGYSDWFLPSRDELGLIRANLHAQALGGLAPDIYMSSSENGPNYNLVIYFGNGDTWSRYKTNSSIVRAVRAF